MRRTSPIYVDGPIRKGTNNNKTQGSVTCYRYRTSKQTEHVEHDGIDKQQLLGWKIMPVYISGREEGGQPLLLVLGLSVDRTIKFSRSEG